MRIAVLIVSIFALLALVATALNDAQVGRYEAMIMTGGHRDTVRWFYDAGSLEK